MIEVVMIICATVIFCTMVICGSWIRVERIRQETALALGGGRNERK